MTFVSTDSIPVRAARKSAPASPASLLTTDHHFCAGCGEPVVLRLLLEVLEELDLITRAVGVVGHGCYGSFVTMADVDFLQCLHGRAPACATGIKRVRPECSVFTVQGDGDMVSEGLQEVLHAAARGERITCLMLNNGVFGDTGGHMTAATVIGQRTKTSLEGRDAALHGYPVPVTEIIAGFPGAGYVARGSVHNAGAIAQTKRMLHAAFTCQSEGSGFSMVEILTMCPTGWFVPTAEGPGYLGESLQPVYPIGELTSAGAAAGGGAHS
jgi:2-oxoglutarate ferredoxin oxidoreductase subunit beta